MSIIGTFTETNGKFSGELRTLSLKAKVTIVPVDAQSEKAPNYRVMAGNAEVGAGWLKTSDKGNTYVSVKIDDPTFPEPVYASLFDKDNESVLIWNRNRQN